MNDTPKVKRAKSIIYDTSKDSLGGLSTASILSNTLDSILELEEFGPERYQTSNRISLYLSKLIDALMARDDEGKNALIDLLNDPRPAVRSSIVDRVYDFAPKVAIPVYLELMKLEGSIGTGARVRAHHLTGC